MLDPYSSLLYHSFVSYMKTKWELSSPEWSLTKHTLMYRGILSLKNSFDSTLLLGSMIK